MNTPPPPAAWRARTGRIVARVAFRVLYRCHVDGAERVPGDRPLIFAANHTGYLDGALVFAMAPRASQMLVLDRNFVGLVGVLLRSVGMIPIDQGTGDRRALGQALAVLDRGDCIGIFPEGGRGRGDLAEASPGVAWLALRSGADVVPVACLGTRATGALASSWPRLRSRLVVEFGEPVRVCAEGPGPGRVRLRRATEEIRVALAAHVASASARHGVDLPQDVPPDLLD